MAQENLVEKDGKCSSHNPPEVHDNAALLLQAPALLHLLRFRLAGRGQRAQRGGRKRAPGGRRRGDAGLPAVMHERGSLTGRGQKKAFSTLTGLLAELLG